MRSSDGRDKQILKQCNLTYSWLGKTDSSVMLLYNSSQIPADALLLGGAGNDSPISLQCTSTVALFHYLLLIITASCPLRVHAIELRLEVESALPEAASSSFVHNTLMVDGWGSSKYNISLPTVSQYSCCLPLHVCGRKWSILLITPLYYEGQHRDGPCLVDDTSPQLCDPDRRVISFPSQHCERSSLSANTDDESVASVASRQYYYEKAASCQPLQPVNGTLIIVLSLLGLLLMALLTLAMLVHFRECGFQRIVIIRCAESSRLFFPSTTTLLSPPAAAAVAAVSSGYSAPLEATITSTTTTMGTATTSAASGSTSSSTPSSTSSPEEEEEEEEEVEDPVVDETAPLQTPSVRELTALRKKYSFPIRVIPSAPTCWTAHFQWLSHHPSASSTTTPTPTTTITASFTDRHTLQLV